MIEVPTSMWLRLCMCTHYIDDLYHTNHSDAATGHVVKFSYTITLDTKLNKYRRTGFNCVV